jgi:glycosyltransferase involved in cell wall biosynthesis
LIYQKALDLGIRAFHSLVLQGTTNISWDIYGEGPEKDELMKLIGYLRLSDFIHLKGFIQRNTLLQKYGTYDVYLFPSLRESCGTSLIEALESGLPVICFDNSGPATVVDHTCGIVCSADGNRDDVINNLYEAITTISQNEYMRRIYSIGAKKRMQKMGFFASAKREKVNLYYENAITEYKKNNC